MPTAEQTQVWNANRRQRHAEQRADEVVARRAALASEAEILAEEIGPTFGGWLSGLIDGEGTFAITHLKTRGGYNCAMKLELRADDSDVLERIVAMTGLGKLGVARRYKGVVNPLIPWRVVSKADCRVLATVLTIYPLRTRKARDFVIWEQALKVWEAHRPRVSDWSYMAEFKKLLEEGRRYK